MPSPDQLLNNLNELKNCEMAVLLIKLLPFMQNTAQDLSLSHICRLCFVNHRNQLKACKYSLLYNLIDLLNYHQKFSMNSTGKLFLYNYFSY